MKRFKNIALVHECDQPTLERAVALAKLNRAKLTIVSPMPELPDGWEQVRIGEKSIDIRKLVIQDHQARLRKVADSVRGQGIRPTTKILTGHPALEIIRDVIQNQRDLVIMTAEGKGGLKERLFGSTSSHLLRKCPAPLLVMKPGRRKRFQRILAAIDPTVTGEARDTLNGVILELASSLAAREEAELHIVHAWTLPGESLLRNRGGLYAAEAGLLIRKEADQRRQLVESLLSKHSLKDHRLHLVKGDASDVIASWVAKLGIDLLVMGTVCRTGIPGLLIGNTAERILNAVDCSVLTVKPKGFVSPMTPLVLAEAAKKVS